MALSLIGSPGLSAPFATSPSGPKRCRPPSRMDNPLVELGLPLRILNALAIAQRYLGLLLLPAVLRYDYSLAQIPLFESFLEPGPGW